MSDGNSAPAAAPGPDKKPQVKKEITDFNEIYKSQPPDSVIVDGKKEKLNLDLVNGSRQVWLVKLPRFLAEKWNNVDDIADREIGKLRMKKNNPDLKFKLILNELMVDADNNEGENGNGTDAEDDEDSTNSGKSKVKREGDNDPGSVKKEKVKAEDNFKFEQVKLENARGGPEIPKASDADVKPSLSGNKVDYFENLPHEYDLRVTNKAVKNQFVFSEQNLQNFGRKRKRPEDEANDKKKAKGGSKKMSRQKFWQQQQKMGPNRFVPFVKSIPKKTALVGTICHECSVTPSIVDKNYSTVLQHRKDKVSRPRDKPTIEFLKENRGVIQGFSAPSLKGDADTFIKANKENKNKEGRAIRMERKELLDLLFKLFDEYDYWSMKGLKERVKQPESWLKESLDSIAILIKRGPYASKYCLKPEYRKLRDVERAERLKALGIEPTEEEENKEDEEDEDVEMENVA